MKTKNILLAAFLTIGLQGFSQQPFYDVTAGNGNGLRLWSSDNYKISLGNAAEYQYGPVNSDFSIKTSMSANTPQRGWTWGVTGQTPVVAINTQGNMQIAGYFQTMGAMGIGSGTSAGSYSTKLHVGGDVLFSPNMAIHSAAYIRGANGYSTAGNPDYTYFNDNTIGIFHPALNVLGFSIANGEAMRIDANRNVGIGTTNPGTYRLAVEGKIGAREFVITNAPWADFVFDTSYKLRSLNEVESFIKTNKHLPEIPSTEEIEKSGLQMGEIQVKQMQKIEELTLYLIEQNKKIEALQNEIKNLKK